MTDNAGTELYIPARNGFDSDNTKHRRNMRAIEEWTKSPFVTSAKIGNAVIETAHIGDAQITNAQINDLSADKITAGTLSAAVIMAGILRTADSGQRWEIDEAGIRAYNADEEQTVNIPAATGDITIKGFIEALGLTVLGNLTLSGTDNKISEGAVITMSGGSGGTDPALGPQLSSVYSKLVLAGRSGARGLFHDSTNGSYWTTEDLTLYEHDDTTGAEIRSKAIPAGSGSGVDAVYGAVRVGTRVYVLCHESAAPGTDTGVKIKVYSESSLTYINQRNVNNFVGAFGGNPCIGDDGTNVIVAFLSSGTVQFSKWTRADLPVYVSTTASSGGGNPAWNNNDPLTGFVAAESKWWVGHNYHQGSAPTEAYAWSTAGVYDASEEFPVPDNGLSERSSVFVSFDGSSVWTHTDWVWTTESPIYWVRYTWVDDNGAASVGARPLGAGDFESVRSPANSILHKKRSTLQITSAEVPGGVSHVGIYVDRGAAEPTLDYVADVAATPGVPVISSLTSFTAGGAAPPTTTTFPEGSGTDAEFQSEDGSPLLRANGYSRLKVTRTTAQTISDSTETEVTWTAEVVDTDGYYTASGEVDIPFTGQYLVIARGKWASNNTGRRRITVQQDTGGGFADTDIQDHQAVGGTAVTHATTASGLLDATAGDQIKVRVFQNSTGNLDIDSAQLSLLFLGPA